MNLKRILLLTTAVFFVGIVSAQATVEITLYDGSTPSGDLFAVPGSTVGWGVYLKNTSATETVEFSSSSFSYGGGIPVVVPDPGIDPVTYSNAYHDHLGDYSLILGPGADQLYVYNSLLKTGGVGNIDTLAGLAAGLTMYGTIDISYSLYDYTLPLNNQYLGFFTDSRDVTVTTVPEPTTYVLLCLSLGVVGYARKRMGPQF